MFTRIAIAKYYRSLLLTSISFGLFLNNPVQARTNTSNQTEQLQISWKTFARQNSSGDRTWGRPPSRTSGGSRTSCEEQLIALVPGKDRVDNQCKGESRSFMTATLAKNPTIWIYIPPSFRSQSAELVILDSQQHPRSRESIDLSETEGIVGLQPDTALAVNQGYRWQLSVLLDPQSPAQNPTVEGLIKRISSSDRLSNLNDSELETARLYARSGIWQDSVTSLAKLYCNNPQDTVIKDDWFNLLSVAGLGAIASKPIVDCQNLAL